MKNTLTLTANELRCLLDFCVPTIVVGFDDPWKRMPADLVEFAGRNALGSLIERGLMFFEGNEARYASDLADFMDVLSEAEECLTSAWVAGDKQGLVSFHRQADRILELTHSPSGEYTLCWIPVKGSILDIIMLPFNGQIVFANGTSSFPLSMAALEEAGDLAHKSGIDAAARYLKGKSISQADVSDLASTLANLKVQCTLANYSGRGDLSTLRSWFCQILCGPDYLWLIEVEDEKSQSVRLQRVTQMNLEKRIIENCPLLR